MSNITMSNIDKWLRKFVKHWETHDIGGVMDLFTEDMEYWETSFVRITDKEALAQEWEVIKEQKEISVSYDIFSKDNDKYAVLCDLRYIDKENKHGRWKGIYLIRLNSENLCDYFLQCGEECNNC